MKEFTYTIKDPLGIHARPAGLFVKEMMQFKSAVTITRGDGSSDAKKLLSLMKLRVKVSETIKVQADGEDEDACIKAAENFLSANL
ncbi:MAG: HPr family phosphocarrier protein [Treponemataceae bacterium]|nr:MAG: HPr family phosphocarrier protein [Treponemataceae bacterium]